MSSRARPSVPGDETPGDQTAQAPDVFAGLTPIDVIEGELLPRQTR